MVLRCSSWTRNKAVRGDIRLESLQGHSRVVEIRQSRSGGILCQITGYQESFLYRGGMLSP